MKKFIYIFICILFLCHSVFAKTENNNDNIDWMPFYNDTINRIQYSTKLLQPEQDVSGRVDILFSIDKKGKMTKIAVKKSSGNKYIDDLGIQAVKNSAPFKPLPKEFKDNEVDFAVPLVFSHWQRKLYEKAHPEWYK